MYIRRGVKNHGILLLDPCREKYKVLHSCTFHASYPTYTCTSYIPTPTYFPLCLLTFQLKNLGDSF